MNGYEQQIKKILGAHGWRYVRSGKGSHEMWGKDGKGNLQTIPKNCKSRNLANVIMKQCGVKHKF